MLSPLLVPKHTAHIMGERGPCAKHQKQRPAPVMPERAGCFANYSSNVVLLNACFEVDADQCGLVAEDQFAVAVG